MKKIFSKISLNNSFWILTVAIFCVLLLPKLVQNGMFLDGVTYATISRNLAFGIGDVFHLHYTNNLYPIFYEHPPFVFWIQALFFQIFGDSIFVERFYSFLMAILNFIGIILIWKLIFINSIFEKYAWFPVLIWITIPGVFWSFQNNILENTVSVFSVFSIYFILRSLISKEFSWIIFASFLIVFAFLSKGLVGLFPIVFGFIYWIVFDGFKLNKNLVYSFFIFILPFLILIISIKIFPQLTENLTFYFKQQLLPALQNKREITVNNRFEILIKLFFELLAPILLSIIVFFKYKKNNFFKKKQVLLFVLIGFSASIPLILSLKQRSFYFVPSISFFAIAFGIYLIPFFHNLIEKTSLKMMNIFKISSIFISIFVIILSISLLGKYSRDENKIRDIEMISTIVPYGSNVCSTKENRYNWGTVAYFARIGNISLNKAITNNYYLLKKEEKISIEIKEKFEIVNLNLSEFVLYKKK